MLGLKPTLSLIFYKNFITFARRLIVFAYFLIVNLSTQCKYHATNLHVNFKEHCKWAKKVIIRFWWESGLSSAFRNHLTTFYRPFVHYACLRSCSAIVHFSETILFVMSAKGIRKRGLGLTPHFSLICYKSFTTCEKEINCFRILFVR